MDRGTWIWCSMVWLIFVPASAALAPDATCFGNSDNKHARRKLDDVAGSISIDCGIPEGFGYTDDKTGIHYTSDAEFIDTGVNVNISPNCTSETLQKSLTNVRSFPQGSRNCYTLRPPVGKDGTYLIRATFMYGNYDNQNRLPEFRLYIGVNEWDLIKFDNASHTVIKEIIHVPLMDNIYVCFLNTGFGTPFISALELRHFHNSNYRTQSGSLVLYRRLDVGSTTDQIVRFKDDVYDRMWFPYNCPQSVLINTSFPTDSHSESEYRLPSTVMKTAARPMNANASLDFNFNIGDPTLDFYVYMHFSELEILQGNQYREFDVALNGKLWEAAIVPSYLRSTTIYSNQSVRGSKLSFSMYKTPNSTLPPILNAMEIYIVKDFLQASTDQEDVNAIMDIKSSYGVNKTWQGDPCEPNTWEGLNCIDSGYDPPRIISLNLTLSGLTGKISPSFSNLKSLQYLDLSNNSLTGAVPYFLSQLPYLRALNLEGNKLSGSVPSALMERSGNGSLSLSVGGNPNLCLLAPCEKKKKNNVVPLVAAIVSSLVIIIALVIFWSYKRKKAAKLVVKSHKEGSLKSDNRQFTYSEIVNITNNFQKVIGKGGFGTVYHGYLSDGVQVAVKMLSSSSAQGFIQFRTEAKLLMRVHHRNLASFVGYCNEGGNIGIIYEYMEFGNLEHYLLDKTREALSWKVRLQIAADAAQGLEYLHHGCKPPIIHRDVKSANILLNEKMQAKIADFGISIFFPIESDSHLSTSVAGTVGYLDPEYYISCWLTEKSDVYSFGIVLLELITGQPAVIIKGNENTHIVQWISPLLARGDIRNIVDPRLQGNYDTNSVWKTLETAMACVPSTSIQRPAISHVVIELKECLDIEIAREITWRMESQTMRLRNSFDMSPSDIETEMGPEAR